MGEVLPSGARIFLLSFSWLLTILEARKFFSSNNSLVSISRRVVRVNARALNVLRQGRV